MLKMHRMGWLGVVRSYPKSLAMSKCLFMFNRNYTSTLYRIRDTASYLLKFVDFDLPHLHLVFPLGVSPFEFRKMAPKNESLSYPVTLFTSCYI